MNREVAQRRQWLSELPRDRKGSKGAIGKSNRTDPLYDKAHPKKGAKRSLVWTAVDMKQACCGQRGQKHKKQNGTGKICAIFAGNRAGDEFFYSGDVMSRLTEDGLLVQRRCQSSVQVSPFIAGVVSIPSVLGNRGVSDEDGLPWGLRVEIAVSPCFVELMAEMDAESKQEAESS